MVHVPVRVWHRVQSHKRENQNFNQNEKICIIRIQHYCWLISMLWCMYSCVGYYANTEVHRSCDVLIWYYNMCHKLCKNQNLKLFTLICT